MTTAHTHRPNTTDVLSALDASADRPLLNPNTRETTATYLSESVTFGEDNEENRAAAEEFLASLPKYLGARVSTCSHRGSFVSVFVGFHASLRSTGVTGEVNETGIKRARRWAQAVADLPLAEGAVGAEWATHADGSTDYSAADLFTEERRSETVTVADVVATL